MRTAKEILTAKKCGDIFSEPDKTVVEREYKEYARRFHPDVCADPDATDVFAKVNLLRDEALKMIAAGQWAASRELPNDKKEYLLGFAEGVAAMAEKQKQEIAETLSGA